MPDERTSGEVDLQCQMSERVMQVDSNRQFASVNVDEGWNTRSFASGVMHWNLQQVTGVNCSIFDVLAYECESLMYVCMYANRIYVASDSFAREEYQPVNCRQY